ncbi:hypothetical protein ACGFI9_36725 [Micromonospora sp. NPDC048930]|uniref:hypothetical protein n=1 Tax=Micromonospora sp. NPDC048930 TaxID=3364261 RepID=UPI00371D3270
MFGRTSVDKGIHTDDQPGVAVQVVEPLSAAGVVGGGFGRAEGRSCRQNDLPPATHRSLAPLADVLRTAEARNGAVKRAVMSGTGDVEEGAVEPALYRQLAPERQGDCSSRIWRPLRGLTMSPRRRRTG